MSTTPRPQVRAAAASRRGPLHVHNEDSWRILLRSEDVGTDTRGDLFVVCDGVSTAGNGLAASSLACERMGQFYEAGTSPSLQGLVELVSEIDWELRGRPRVTACTLSVLWLHEWTAYGVSVGDSPIMRLRGSEVERAWTSNSRGGRLGAFLGMGPEVTDALQVQTWSVRPGDVFVVMSDGVDGVVADAGLVAAWGRTGQPQRMADELIDLVARESGQDDATALVVHVVGVKAPSERMLPLDAPDPPHHLSLDTMVD